MKLADIVLSAASFAEGDSTVVSQEGRAQRFYQVMTQATTSLNMRSKNHGVGYMLLRQVLKVKAVDWTLLDDVIDDIVKMFQCLKPIQDVAPDAGYRVHGLKIAREPRRYSGRTAMRAPLSVHEPKQPTDPDSALTFSMEGYVGNQTASSLVPFAWAAGWNSPQAWNKVPR